MVSILGLTSLQHATNISGKIPALNPLSNLIPHHEHKIYFVHIKSETSVLLFKEN